MAGGRIAAGRRTFVALAFIFLVDEVAGREQQPTGLRKLHGAHKGLFAGEPKPALIQADEVLGAAEALGYLVGRQSGPAEAGNCFHALIVSPRYGRRNTLIRAPEKCSETFRYAISRNP